MLHRDMGTAAEHFLVGGLGVGAVVGLGFLLLPLPNAQPKYHAQWCAMRACLLHYASCRAGSSCPQTCMGAWVDLAVSTGFIFRLPPATPCSSWCCTVATCRLPYWASGY